MPKALRFSLSIAVGVIIAEPGAAPSDLTTFGPSGEVTQAIVSGSASIRGVFVSLYTTNYLCLLLADSAPECRLAELAIATGAVRCLESDSALLPPSATTPPPVQFDAAGGIYAFFSTAEGRGVLRRYAANTVKEVHLSSESAVSEFLVFPDAQLFLRGSSNSREWIRRYATDGTVTGVYNGSVRALYRIPDNNLVFETALGRLHRFLTATNTLEGQVFLGDSASNPRYSFDDLCHSAAGTAPCPAPINRAIPLSSFGMVGAVGDPGSGTAVIRYYPTPLLLPAQVKAAFLLEAGGGGEFFLAGLNSANNNILSAYNLTDNTESELLGGDGEVELYQLRYREGTNTVYYAGLRYADWQHVLGACTLKTMDCQTLAVLPSSVRELRLLPSAPVQRYQLCVDARQKGSTVSGVEYTPVFTSPLEYQTKPFVSRDGGSTCYAPFRSGTTFTLTPRKAGVVFTPPTLSGSISGNTALTVEAAAATYPLCGTASYGVTVEWREAVDGVVVRQATSDRSGAYCFKNVLTGTHYYLRATDGTSTRYLALPETPPNGVLTSETTVNFERLLTIKPVF